MKFISPPVFLPYPSLKHIQHHCERCHSPGEEVNHNNNPHLHTAFAYFPSYLVVLAPKAGALAPPCAAKGAVHWLFSRADDSFKNKWLMKCFSFAPSTRHNHKNMTHLYESPIIVIGTQALKTPATRGQMRRNSSFPQPTSHPRPHPPRRNINHSGLFGFVDLFTDWNLMAERQRVRALSLQLKEKPEWDTEPVWSICSTEWQVLLYVCKSGSVIRLECFFIFTKYQRCGQYYL